MNLFQQAELGFDKLFGYNRQQSESFDHYNTMMNNSISEQLKLQEQDATAEKKKETLQSCEKENKTSRNLDNKQDNEHSYNQQNNSDSDSLLSIFSLEDDNNYEASAAEDLQARKRKNTKKRESRL